MNTKRVLLCAVCVLTFAHGLQAAVIDVPVSQVGRYNQTVVSRSDQALTGDFLAVMVNSSSNAGGSGGVWSGVDVDFVYLSTSPVFGDPNATVILPDLGAGTYVQTGTRRAGAPYETALHPGVFFGLNVDGSIDHATAGLHSMNAAYPQFVYPGLNLVDSSTGWVTLGDGGRLVADLGNVSGTFYVFLGEAATSGEPATVQLVQPEPIPEPASLAILSAGGLLGVIRRRSRR